jgi:hypothetical protein
LHALLNVLCNPGRSARDGIILPVQRKSKLQQQGATTNS